MTEKPSPKTGLDRGRIRIGRQLLALVSISLLGLVLLAVFSLETLRRTAARIREAESQARVHGALYNRMIQGKDLVADVLPPPAYIIEMFLTASRVADSTNAAEIDRLTADLVRQRKEYDERQAYWTRTLPPGELREAVTRTAHEPAVRFFAALEQDFLPAIRTNHSQAQAVLQNQLTTEYTNQRAAIDRVVKLAEGQNAACEADLGRVLQDSDLEVRRALRFAMVATVTGLLVLALVAGLAGGRISTLITREVRAIALELGGEARQISDAAHQVSRGSQVVAEGASSQSAALQQTSASLQELTSMTEVNLQHAHEATDLAGRTHRAAEGGARHMEELNTAIRDINASSDDIGRIIKVIDEIAFQTNILALNAAVEAARAGEAGMGFAVVADEVRNLARRSAEAAQETSRKIESAVARSTRVAELGGKVTAAFADILTHARGVSDLDVDVANGSSEQSKGINQINSAVGEMERVTQVNAASAEESAAAARELSSQAERMQDSVNKLLGMVAATEAAGEHPLPPTATPGVRPPARRSAGGRLSFHSQPPSTRPTRSAPSNANHGPNCWEFKKCGREAGGAKARELGVCPAYPKHGRSCASLAGTLCGGKVQGSFASKISNCMHCDFYKSPHYHREAVGGF